MSKLSDYIFDFLKEKGLSQVFMLPGGGAMHLVDSLGKSNLPYVCFLHEQAAAIAGESYGQHKNEPALVLVTSGPGGTNAVTGVTAAYIDSTPMIVVSGQAKTCDLVGNKGVRQIGSQEVNIVDIVKPITKYAVQVSKASDIRYILERAWYEANSERKGPVWIDIPLDIQAASVEPEKLKGFCIPKSNKVKKLNAKLFDKLYLLLKNAKKPVFLAGNGIYTANAVSDFEEFIKVIQIPVQTTWKSIDLMYEDHPLYAGHPGTLGDRGANFIIQDSDLLLCVGARIDNSITAFNESAFAPNAKKIVVDIDQHELNKFSMKIDERICCDAKIFLQKFNDYLKDKEPVKNADWLLYCKEIRKKYPVVLPEFTNEKQYVNGYYFTDCLCEKLTENDVIVPESSGVTCEVTIQAFKNKIGQKIKHAAGLGSMGFGLPYAIGACVANNKRRTILINGDGAFQLNIQELETLHRLNLPVKIFIWDNNGYASIRGMQRNNFAGHYVASDVASGLTLPDIAKVAEAYGMKTYHIKNNSEIHAKLDEILSDSSLALCMVDVSPDSVVALKVQSKMQKDGTMLPGRLNAMWPFINEE